jgi:hypothetical protein
VAAPSLDAEIDRLYQLRLDEFTAARNALAKEAGTDSAAIKRLQKPPLAAWAINQVYWKRRPTFDALKKTASALQSTHTAVLSGKRGDLRSAGQAHEEALEAVLKAATDILRDAGQPATEATRQAIATTLRALPTAPDSPGRLTRTLQPGGFELLAGLPVHTGRNVVRLRKAAARERPSPMVAEPPARVSARAKAVAKVRDKVNAALQTLRTAEQTARREEFEAARTARESDRAAERLDKARKALEDAQSAVDKAAREASSASRKKEAAAERAREADSARSTAQARANLAQAELAKAEQS